MRTVYFYLVYFSWQHLYSLINIIILFKKLITKLVELIKETINSPNGRSSMEHPVIPLQHFAIFCVDPNGGCL